MEVEISYGATCVWDVVIQGKTDILCLSWLFDPSGTSCVVIGSVSSRWGVVAWRIGGGNIFYFANGESDEM